MHIFIIKLHSAYSKRKKQLSVQRKGIRWHKTKKYKKSSLSHRIIEIKKLEITLH